MNSIDKRIAELAEERKRMDKEALEALPEQERMETVLEKETAELVDDVYKIVLYIEEKAMKDSALFVDAMCGKGIDSLRMYPLVLSISSKENSIELVINIAGNPDNSYISVAKSEKAVLLENIAYYLSELLIIRKDSRDLLTKGIDHTEERLCPYDIVITSKRLKEK